MWSGPHEAKMRTLVFVLFASTISCGSSEHAPLPPAPVEDAGPEIADTGSPDVSDASVDEVSDADAIAAGPRSVLFVGNSYTYVGDLPGQLRDLAASAPASDRVSLAIESVTVGGATLQMHYESTGALAKIREKKWTHVVLQGQSVEPIATPTSFQNFAKKLADETKLAGATPIFYETWARKEGDAVYAETWSGGDPSAMQKLLRAAYEKAAKNNGALLARVGDAREIALGKSFSFSLYDPDGSHPTVEGAYLGACVFHNVIINRPSAGLPFRPTTLTKDDALALQTIADGLGP